MSDPESNKTTNLKDLRADVTETTNVLKITVEKLVDRGDRLDVLSARADDLNTSSHYFHGSSRRLQRNMKCRNYKVTIFIGKRLSMDQKINIYLFIFSYDCTRCNWYNCVNCTSSVEKIIN